MKYQRPITLIALGIVAALVAATPQHSYGQQSPDHQAPVSDTQLSLPDELRGLFPHSLSAGGTLDTLRGLRRIQLTVVARGVEKLLQKRSASRSAAAQRS